MEQTGGTNAKTKGQKSELPVQKMDVLQCAVYETNRLFFHSQDFYLLQQWRASKM